VTGLFRRLSLNVSSKVLHRLSILTPTNIFYGHFKWVTCFSACSYFMCNVLKVNKRDRLGQNM
jgi:hypothetical protein